MSANESRNSILPSRRELLKTAPAALAGIAAQTAAAAPDPARPNIVVIFRTSSAEIASARPARIR